MFPHLLQSFVGLVYFSINFQTGFTFAENTPRTQFLSCQHFSISIKLIQLTCQCEYVRIKLTLPADISPRPSSNAGDSVWHLPWERCPLPSFPAFPPAAQRRFSVLTSLLRCRILFHHSVPLNSSWLTVPRVYIAFVDFTVSKKNGQVFCKVSLSDCLTHILGLQFEEQTYFRSRLTTVSWFGAAMPPWAGQKAWSLLVDPVAERWCSRKDSELISECFHWWIQNFMVLLGNDREKKAVPSCRK